MPLVVRAILVVAIVALAGAVLWTASGQLPRLVGAIGDAFGGFTSGWLATPSPSPTPVEILDSPVLDPPDEPYTNRETVDITGSVPAEIAGRKGYVIRIWVALPDQVATVVRETAVGETPAFVVAELPLSAGRNVISATIAGPGSESEPSPSITYVLDTSKPAITISSPKNKATINGPTVTIKGKTQGRSEVVARNETSGAVGTASAKSDGTFSVKVGLGGGTNTIRLTVTDPAGNAASKAITVRRGAVEATVKLTASATRISASKLPRALVLTAVVTDPSGRPIQDAPVTFTVSVPGVPAITGDATTNASGVATFRLTIPKGATIGTGPATALATTEEYGDISTSIVITIVR
jgi:hypothetical protein